MRHIDANISALYLYPTQVLRCVLSIGANISARANEFVYNTVMHSPIASYSSGYFLSALSIASGK